MSNLPRKKRETQSLRQNRTNNKNLTQNVLLSVGKLNVRISLIELGRNIQKK